MDDELLVEVRKISAWVERSRRYSRWTLYALIPIILVWAGIAFFLSSLFKSPIEEHESAPPSWYDVRRMSTAGKFEEALAAGAKLLGRDPDDYDGHYRMGEVLLKAGKREQALESFRRATEIFPIRKHLDAVEALESGR